MIKRLAKCIREYKRDTIITPILMAVEVLLECVLPLFTSSLINTLESFSDKQQIESTGIIADINEFVMGLAGGDIITGIIYHGLFLLLIAVCSLCCGALGGRTVANASSGFAKNLRHDIFYRVQGFSFANIDKFSTNSLITRLTTDVNNVQNAFMMLIRTGIRAPLMFIFAVTLAFQVSKTIALVSLGMIVIMMIGAICVFSKVMPIFNKVFKKYDKLNESVQENIKGMRVVKAYVREDYEKQKFDKASDDMRADFTRAEKIIAINEPIMRSVMYVNMLVIVFVGALMALGVINPLGDNMQIGEITSLLQYGMQTLSSMMMLSMIFVMCTIAVESARRIYEVLKEESNIINCENPIMDIASGDIEFRDVSFKYSAKAKKSALMDVNLTIKSGETVGILGGTGSSKTTLIQLIPRLYDCTEGEVYVGGRNVKEYDLTALRDAVSVVLQKNLLFSGTIKDNLRWGDPNATDEEMKRACKLACADSFIESFPDGYDTFIEQGGSNVSGGQKQRLCIARALLKKPKILILDDSTSAVDMRTDAMIRKAFSEEIPNTTKIIIAQRIASVQDADKIIILDGGKINGIGTHEELLKNNAIYQEVYYSQNKAEDKEVM